MFQRSESFEKPTQDLRKLVNLKDEGAPQMSLVSYSSSSDGEMDADKKSIRHSEDVATAFAGTHGLDSKKRKRFTKSELKKKRRLRKGKGPWGSWSESESSSAEEYEEHVQEIRRDEELKINDEENTESSENFEEVSIFHGENEHDYQGRGILHPPAEVNVDFSKQHFKCFLPKKRIYSYQGHARGTSALNFLPHTGHLFLSGGNDNLVKIWDFYHDRTCLRDYRGHQKPIKALDFNDDGSNFLSASFDQYVRSWDTETGIIKARYSFSSTPNDLKYRPLHGNEFIVGLSNSKINHFDDRVAAKQGLVQVYDHHLSSILSLEFFPDGSKFISSSEDKTVRIWENQVNIPIKQISDTSQHSMPFLKVHPDHHYFCAQSMDNTIYSFSMKPKYRRHPNKSFNGHQSAGYGIHIGFSPDGHYLLSGDSKSRLFVWDWTTTKLLKTFELPGRKPVTQVGWHPQETSKVLCSGTTGKIHVLD
ncbi:probable Pre-mRNA-processing factor 17 [Zygosaccharomyces bailii ISA1307]|nr:probable Pre-mRNA-processing factor 17 [Zygosaccharomyces bailii ISA1307]